MSCLPIEAARLAPLGRRIVEISVVPIDGVDKLAIWNTGPAMDAGELLSICDIASSLGKEKSLTGNFGMAGRVHEVILCKRDGVYGRLRRLDQETDEFHEVVDVTGLAVQDGRTLIEDWTEVVLLGNTSAQDTVNDPYNGDPAQEKQWLATYLYHRFYRLPDDVKVTLLKGTNKLDGNRQFEAIPARLRYFAQHEAVAVPGDIKIHYLYDAPFKESGHNQSIKGSIASAVSTAAVIYKNEMYDVRKGRNWTFDAPIFGIPFGAKHISIHIELPGDYSVVPEGYRQALRYRGGEQPQVQASDFAEIVREHRPQWLIEIIRSFAPESSSNDDIRNELQKLLNDLRVRRISPKVIINGPNPVTLGNGPASDISRGNNASGGNVGDRSRYKPADLSVLPTGAKRADIFKNLERAPEIVLLREDNEIEEVPKWHLCRLTSVACVIGPVRKELKGRAARYYLEPGQLFVNMQYPAITVMKAQLEDEYASANDPELMRSLALQTAERAMILRVGRTVVYALAKQLSKEWDQKAVETASSPESLSMAADDFADAMQNARRTIGKALRPNRARVESQLPGLTLSPTF